jgi:dTDP-4-dehydrorhamnose reductase
VSFDRVLITGGGGQLASDLQALLVGRATVAAPPRSELDVTDDTALADVFDSVRPQLVLNCAAFHNVEVCESEEERSFAVNARAVKRLAARCEQSGTRLVHFSSNYVFDGRREQPYGEDDRPHPRSVYAISKLAGEHCALAYAGSALVVRSAGLYGRHGSASKGGNFVTRMVGRAQEQGALRMVADQRLNPTFTGDLARAVLDAVEAGAGGILHLTNAGDCSWYEFTQAIMELAGIDVPIEPVTTNRPPGGADRPLNGALARPRADELGIPPLRGWREALEDYMRLAGLALATESAGGGLATAGE